MRLVAWMFLVAWLSVSTVLANPTGNQNHTGNHNIDDQNVVWNTPSKDSSGSMPLGNGRYGLNVWVEKSGDLLFYVSSTDAWSENARLLKLGRVRIGLTPNPFADGTSFSQELRLRDGAVVIRSGEGNEAVSIGVWVDANRPVVHVDVESASPRTLRAALEVWRTERRRLGTGGPFGTNEEFSAYGLHGRKRPGPVFVEPDVVVGDQRDRIVWYHRNKRSIWSSTLKLQGMESFIARSSDPLLHRTFGGCIRGESLASDGPTVLKSVAPRRRFAVSIHLLTARAADVSQWIERLDRQMARVDSVDPQTAAEAHRRWWCEFWDRSWVRVTGSPEADVLTRGYVLQRWINACGGRGGYPIKFNGSIFTVDAREPDKHFDADFRAWGGPYWWQNTRLPYWPMLACGDFDLMTPVFRMYQDSLPLAEERSRVWFGHEGAFLPETMYFWGTFVNENYGWDRRGRHARDVKSRWVGREYTCSLELMAMMLDYYAHTRNDRFLKEALLPTCDSLLTFWDRHYRRDADGYLHMEPAQSLETWQDAVNPAPDVAGLHWVLGKLLQLPEDKAGAERRKFWGRLAGEVRPLLMAGEDGRRYLLPAEKVLEERKNSENPELYAVFPFRVFGVGKPDLEIGRLTFARREIKKHRGWQQDDVQAAFLGLADEAAGYVTDRAANRHRGSRFPAFWGPNYDWIPDQTHGGNLMTALQTMLLQTEDDKILLLPAWPKQWDVAFKLQASDRTVVECVYRGGKIERLTVTPTSRAKDVVYCTPQ
jgi:hypothetical protein